MGHIVPKRWPRKFRRRGINQKKEYNRFKFPSWGVVSPSPNFRSSSLHPLPVHSLTGTDKFDLLTGIGKFATPSYKAVWVDQRNVAPRNMAWIHPFLQPGYRFNTGHDRFVPSFCNEQATCWSTKKLLSHSQQQQEIPTLPNLRDRLCDQPTSYPMHTDLSPKVKRPRCYARHQPHLNTRLRVSGAIPPLLHRFKQHKN
jgi:hypothetical protein